MSEKYPGHAAAGATSSADLPPGSGDAAAHSAARALVAQLLPDANADQVARALVAERMGTEVARAESHEADATELARVRTLFALGGSAREAEHAFNNPLTALIAEAQLLGLEDLPAEHRSAVERILDLSRRLVTISRQLGGGTAVPRSGARRSKEG